MTVASYQALQKQIRLLTNKPLNALSLAALEIALEGIGVPAARRTEELRKAIQLGRDQADARRARKEARNEAP
jgi:hypothetical protein